MYKRQDHGEVALAGSVEEVVRAYEGNQAGDHVARIIADMEKEDQERSIDSRRGIPLDSANSADTADEGA